MGGGGEVEWGKERWSGERRGGVGKGEVEWGKERWSRGGGIGEEER